MSDDAVSGWKRDGEQSGINIPTQFYADIAEKMADCMYDRVECSEQALAVCECSVKWLKQTPAHESMWIYTNIVSIWSEHLEADGQRYSAIGKVVRECHGALSDLGRYWGGHRNVANIYPREVDVISGGLGGLLRALVDDANWSTDGTRFDKGDLFSDRPAKALAAYEEVVRVVNRIMEQPEAEKARERRDAWRRINITDDWIADDAASPAKRMRADDAAQAATHAQQ